MHTLDVIKIKYDTPRLTPARVINNPRLNSPTPFDSLFLLLRTFPFGIFLRFFDLPSALGASLESLLRASADSDRDIIASIARPTLRMRYWECIREMRF